MASPNFFDLSPLNSPVHNPTLSFDSSEIGHLQNLLPTSPSHNPSQVGPTYPPSEDRSEGTSRRRGNDEEVGNTSAQAEENRDFDTVNFTSFQNSVRYSDIYQFYEVISGTWVNYRAFEKLQNSLIWIKLLKDQGWEDFIKIKENIYPDLVKQFYANLSFIKFDEKFLGFKSRVKGVVLKYNIREIANIFGFKDHTNDGIILRGGGLWGKTLDISHDEVGYDIFQPFTHIPGRTYPSAHFLKFHEKILQMLIIKNIRPQKGSTDYVSILTAFLIYALKHKLPIDFSSMLLSFMESEPLCGKLPYGMVLTRLFKYADINLEGERFDKPTGRGFTPYSLSRSGMTYNLSSGSWSWNGRIVASPSLDPLTNDTNLLDSIYKAKTHPIQPLPTRTQTLKRRRMSGETSVPPTYMPGPSRIRPETSTRSPQTDVMEKLDSLTKASTKILHQNASAKKARAAILEQLRFLYTNMAKRDLIDPLPTNLFDFAESEESEFDTHEPGNQDENSDSG